MAGVWYREGTVSLTRGSKVVTGAGSRWASTTPSVRPGALFIGPDGLAYEIDSVVSDTQMALVTDYAGETAAGQRYAVVRLALSIPQFSEQLSQFVAKNVSFYDQIHALLSADGTVTLTDPDTGQTVTVPSWKRIADEGEGQAARAEQFANQAVAAAGHAADETRQQLSDIVGQASDSASRAETAAKGAADETRQQLSDIVGQVSDSASRAEAAAKGAADETRQQLSDIVGQVSDSASRAEAAAKGAADATRQQLSDIADHAALSAGKAEAAASKAGSAVTDHEAKAGAHPISGVDGLQDILDNLAKSSGDPVLSPKWMQKRSAMWTGYAPQDGQLLSRALYPDAFAGILAGMLPVCSDADWLANPGMRGCATLGDGSTTFRLPDLNGAQPGSYGPVYLGGGTTDGGTILRDRIQNITAKLAVVGSDRFGTVPGSMGDGGAALTYTTVGNANVSLIGAGANLNGTLYRGDFDASRVARTGDTSRPITAEGCIAIKLFGAVQNIGSADAAALATAVAALAAQVTALEARKFTAIVPATYPSGAPHASDETVSASLPASVVNNTEYVLVEPFGAGVPVTLKVQLWIGGFWCDAGWDGNANNLAYGVVARQRAGYGIVVQTGATGVDAGKAIVGGGAGNSSGVVTTSAPCRVLVSRMDM